ncbi:XdhC family protein [Streptomyces canus]|uniref:XdhC family protein n=1 Tax=Streptomyces canus TaxID=58343 RepID=UPI002E2D52B8|nr:XdhC family protein [Streptomyces canus]
MSATAAGRSRPIALAAACRRPRLLLTAPGARLPVRRDGSTVGNLTGGCLDAETVQATDEVERTGAPGR